MLVAEEVASLAGKTLDFGDWEGADADRSWARSLRVLLKEQDVGAEDTQPLIEAEGRTVKVNPSGSVTSRHAIRVESTEADSDDDSLQGYGSDGNSDRTPSPTPSELDEIEKDPTLNVGVKKVPKPVYLTQLGELVRSTNAGLKSAENNEPDKIKMALNSGEELVRRKRNFGLELGKCCISRRDSADTECNRGDRRESCIRVYRTAKFV